jgi:hypothetical protein
VDAARDAVCYAKVRERRLTAPDEIGAFALAEELALIVFGRAERDERSEQLAALEASEIAAE